LQVLAHNLAISVSDIKKANCSEKLKELKAVLINCACDMSSVRRCAYNGHIKIT